MPIYLYQCEACGVRFEKLQHMSADPLTDCPECDGPVHRVIQPVGVIFKGSGFYVTDNRKSSSPTLAPPKDGDKSKEVATSSSEEAASAEKPESTPSKAEDAT
jgi:putative FmdB family regulatory protein